MTLPYFIGGEDGDFIRNGTLLGVTTSAGWFQGAGINRCALTSNPTNNGSTSYWRAQFDQPRSSFWVSTRLIAASQSGNVNGNGNYTWLFYDANAALRLYIKSTSASGAAFSIYKYNLAGTSTLLGSFSFPTSTYDNGLIKYDINVVYGVAGSIAIYQAGTLVYSLVNTDLTTDGNTTLNYLDLGSPGYALAFTGATVFTAGWSEVVVHPNSTINMTCVTGNPAANGVNMQMTGAITDINETTLNNVSANISSAANQVQEYTSSAIASGLSSYTVRSVTMSGTLLRGSTGPQHYNWLLRLSGTDYLHATQRSPPNITYGPQQNHWDVNPLTGVTFQQSEIGNASGFNFGLKSAA